MGVPLPGGNHEFAVSGATSTRAIALKTCAAFIWRAYQKNARMKLNDVKCLVDSRTNIVLRYNFNQVR